MKAVITSYDPQESGLIQLRAFIESPEYFAFDVENVPYNMDSPVKDQLVQNAIEAINIALTKNEKGATVTEVEFLT